MVRRNDDGRSLVEFLVEEPADAEIDDRIGRSGIAPELITGRARRRLIADAVAAIGAVGAVVSAFLPQLVVRIGHASYSVDGFGHYRMLAADPRAQLMGHAPPLGAVALVAGILLLIVVCGSWFVPWRVGAVAGAFAGAVAGAFACQSVEAPGWPEASWSYGWWVLGASAQCTVAGTAAAHIGHPLSARTRPVATR